LKKTGATASTNQIVQHSKTYFISQWNSVTLWKFTSSANQII